MVTGGNSTDAEKVIYSILLAYICFLAVFIILSLVRRQYHPLKIRASYLYAMETLCFIVGPLVVFYGRIFPFQITCGLLVYFVAIGYVTGMLIFAMRAFYYYYVYNWNHEAIRYGGIAYGSEAIVGQKELTVFRYDTLKKLRKKIYTESFFIRSAVLCALLLSAVVLVGLHIGSDYATSVLAESSCRSYGFSVYVILLGLWIITGIIAFKVRYSFRVLQDNFGLHKNFRLTLVNSVLSGSCMVICLIPQVFEASEEYFQFLDILAFGIPTLSLFRHVCIPVLETWTGKYQKHEQLDRLFTPDRNSQLPRALFTRCLANEEALECFKQFLVKEFSTENLCFWFASTKYAIEAERLFREDNMEELRNNAATIFNDFISLNSLMTINISARTRMIVTDIYETGQKGILSNEDWINMYRDAQSEVLGLLIGDSFVRFLCSEEYQLLGLEEHDEEV